MTRATSSMSPPRVSRASAPVARKIPGMPRTRAVTPAYFFSCDWGTSRLRVRLVRGPGDWVIADSESDEGVATVAPAGGRLGSATRARAFFAVLRPHLVRLSASTGLDYSKVPLVVSGMISSTLGVCELPYAQVPFRLDGTDLRIERYGPGPDWPVQTLLISGVRTAIDVMRGEETQVIGWATGHVCLPSQTVVILPGTHSKHLEVDGAQVNGFVTYMTGEFFSLLAEHGVLAGTVARRTGRMSASGHAQFAAGVRTGARENLLHASFLVRTRALLSGASASDNRNFLSGLLIGKELAALAGSTVPHIDIVADAPIDRLYERALRTLGFAGPIRRHSARSAVVAGHGQIARLARLVEG